MDRTTSISNGLISKIATTVLLLYSNLSIISAQSSKAFEWSFIGVANISVPHSGINQHLNKPLLMGYEDLTLDWRPWTKKNKDHRLRARLLATQGNGLSATAIGDLQVMSNIEAGNYIGLFELNYTHQFNDHHSLLIGQSDLCSNFMSLDAALYFANSSFGALPTLTLNTSAPVFPTGAPSLVYTFEKPRWHWSVAVFDGFAGNTDTNPNNLKPMLSAEEGALVISEICYHYTDVDQIILGCHSHQNMSENELSGAKTQQSQTSVYAMAQKSWGITDDNDMPNWQLFSQVAVSPSQTSLAAQYFSLGCLHNNVFNCFDENNLGLGIAHLRLGQAYIGTDGMDKQSETNIELFYEVQMLKKMFIRPSFSHIVNAGASSNKANVNVSSVYLRLEL
jgi:carbohydrate-selective porin OprB